MAKIAYNACYGGFGLSTAAILRYAELAGITLATLRYAELVGITLEKRTDTWGDSWFIADGEYFDAARIDREDPHLIQVIEELGPDANGRAANLTIHEVPNGTIYRIEDYDGNEHIVQQRDYEWHVAGQGDQA